MPLSQQKQNKLARLAQKQKKEQTDTSMKTMLSEMRAILEQEMKEKLDSMMKELQKRNSLDPEFLEGIIRDIASEVFVDVKGDVGEKGDTPKKGVDYMTQEDIAEMADLVFNSINVPADGKTPEAGVDYPTLDQVKDIVRKQVEQMPKPQDGVTPQKGLDYFTDADVNAIAVIVLNDVLKKLSPKDIKTKLAQVGIEHNMVTDFKDAVLNIINQNIGLLRSKVQKGGAGGGGGMGNWVHESNLVDSSTTSVSTTNKVGANGFAIFAYYQGQHLYQGDQYTMGADKKTLTLTFTPTDNTYIDIIYVRA